MSTSTCPSCGGPADPGTGVCPVCTTQVNPALGMTPTLGGVTYDGPSPTPQIPGYEIIGQLGEGGMGAVYLAEETALGRRVAIKVISRRVSADVQSKARFLREARTLATIEHPHVVRVYSFGEVDGQPYLVMEYVEGETLADRISRVGKLDIEEATRITRDIIDALDAAWDKKVIHRDIKPSNILIDRRNRVRVADFGLAKPISLENSDASLTGTGLMVGTPYYVSPEQAQGTHTDFRSDFYSVGVLLYHMLTGERPFEGATPFAIVAKQMHEALPSMRSRRVDIPPELERLTQWLSEKDSGRRPASHAQLLSALDGLIVHTPSSPMPSFSTVAIEKPLNRWRLAGVGMLILLVIAAGAILYWRLRPAAPTVPVAAARNAKFVVAVAPFYGPDDDSIKEGRLMAAMIERAIVQRLGAKNAQVLGIEETKSAVRNDDSARELGTRLNADAVIWGEAFALRNETEIQPHVTMITGLEPDSGQTSGASDDARLFRASRADAAQALEGAGAAPLKLQAEAPNQIELRKTSASGIGDLVLVLAGIHALENEKDPRKALGFFEQTPETSETLRYRVQALLEIDDKEKALPLLERAIALEPRDAPSQALLGDLFLTAGRVPDAIAAYGQAASVGAPYTTTRGILFGGRLYRTENYSSHLQPKEGIQTIYLLGVDPSSLRVVTRHAMPGTPASLRIEGDTLVIGNNLSRPNQTPAFAEVRLRGGRFDRPLWPTPNLLQRMQSLKAGWVPAANFLEAFEEITVMGETRPPFVVRKNKFTPGGPGTLPELERHLREEIVRDPTQPWNLFFLAVALREQKRDAEGNAVIADLARRDDPGVPYNEFTWMLNFATRMRAHEWEAPLWAKVVKQRRLIPQPPDFGTLIERLINGSFSRIAAKVSDRERGYEALQRVRTLGLTPEGEDLVAAVWAKHFEKTGDPRARQEREIIRRTHAHPFNFTAATARIDYALTAAIAAMVGFVVLLVMVLITAHLRPRLLPEPPPRTSALLAWKERLFALSRLARVAAATLIVGLLALGAFHLYLNDEAGTAIVVAIVIALPLLVIRLFRVKPRQLIAAISAQERRALFAAWALLVIAAIVLTDRILIGNELWLVPVGLSDSIGHPRIVTAFENRIEERGDGDPALRYAAAVINHYAGNKERAAALYQTLPADYAGSAKNREALSAGRMPAATLTADQLFRGWSGTRTQRWRRLVDIRDMMVQGPIIVVSAVLGIGLILITAIFLGPRPTAVEGTPLSRGGKVASLLLPGLYDLRRGHPWRALITLILAASLIVPLLSTIARWGDKVAAVGPLSALSLPAIEGTFPLPDREVTPDAKLTMTLAFAHAKLFFALVAAAALAAIALHLLRIRPILREPVVTRDTAAVRTFAG